MIFLERPFMATTKTVIDVQSGKLSMTVLGETVQIQATDLLTYPFGTSHKQCSNVDYFNFPMFDPSFQGKDRANLEVVHSKDKWKR